MNSVNNPENNGESISGFKIKDYAIYLIMLGIFIVFAFFLRNRGFLSIVNLMNIFRQTAIISVMAVGFTFVIASGEFDLSIGSTVALSALVGSLMLQRTGIFPAVIAAVAVGAVIGFVNGFFVVRARMPSFLATIAMMGIIHGLARWITHLQAIPVLNDRFTYIFGGGNLGPIPTLFVWTLIVMVFGQIAMVKTLFGRKVLATGGNVVAARLAGINTDKVKWVLFIIMGMIASLAGLLYTGRLHAARYTYGGQDLFTIVAAVVIGGNSIYGGTGTIIGAVVGSLILGMVNNGLILFGFSVDQQVIFRGVMILVAVALSPSAPKE
jgi:ribose transport system permease protein